MKSALLSFCTLYQFTSGQPIPQYIPMYVPITTAPVVTEPAVPVATEPAIPVGTQPANPLPSAVNPPPATTVPPLVQPLPVVPEPPVIQPVPIPQPPVSTLPAASSTQPAVPAVVQTATQPNPFIGAFGQTCESPVRAKCLTPTDVLSRTGFLSCEGSFSCCLCASIECTTCDKFIAGTSGIFGVGAVTIAGKPGGAEINCGQFQSCAEAIITASNIRTMAVSGEQATKGATVTITNPSPDFKLECTASSSCEGLKLELLFPLPSSSSYCGYSTLRLGGIQCSGSQSCKNMDVTITNQGCNKVVLDKVECTTPDACLTANFNFIGDVEIANCDLGTSGHTMTGMGRCYQNLQKLLCQEAGSCKGIVKALVNPAKAFSLECGAAESCLGAQITLFFNSAPWYNPVTGMEFAEPTTWIDGFKFSGDSSGAGATIRINNMQRGKTLEIENIECVARAACTGTTFILGKDVEIVNVLCYPGTCDACLVKVEPTDPGLPCQRFVNI